MEMRAEAALGLDNAGDFTRDLLARPCLLLQNSVYISHENIRSQIPLLISNALFNF